MHATKGIMLLMVVGCATHADSTPTKQIACRQPVADYCASVACVQSIDQLKQDFLACSMTLDSCGGYDVVYDRGIDTGHTWYFRDGKLVAYERYGLGPGGCVAGPPTFDAPQCEGPGQPLVSCAGATP